MNLNMSAETPEPWELELLFNGEGNPATPEDIQVMETIATDLVETIPAELHKDCSFENEETGASLHIRTTRYEDIFMPNTSVAMSLSRDDEELPKISIAFDSSNDLVYLGFDSDEGLAEAQVIGDELLADNLLEARPAAIVKCLCRLATRLAGVEVEQLPIEDVDKIPHDDKTHVADVTRDLLDDILGDQMMSTKEYGLYLGDNRVVTVIKRDLLDFRSEEEKAEDYDPEDSDYEEPTKSLHVILEERNQGLAYHYLKVAEGRRILEVVPVDVELEIDMSVEDPDNSLIEAEISGITDQLHTIRASNVELITAGLIDALAIDNEVLPSVGEGWSYPELQFGFNIDPHSEQIDLVREALRSLDTTVQYMLPEKCPAGFPTQPNYSFSPNKHRRIENFMHQKVSTYHNPTLRASRYSIVDLPTAAELILDELSVQNHPVSQMVAQLYDEYGLDLGFDTVKQIATGVVMHTHWSKLRNHLTSQIETWRYNGRTSAMSKPV